LEERTRRVRARRPARALAGLGSPSFFFACCKRGVPNDQRGRLPGPVRPVDSTASSSVGAGMARRSAGGAARLHARRPQGPLKSSTECPPRFRSKCTPARVRGVFLGSQSLHKGMMARAHSRHRPFSGRCDGGPEIRCSRGPGSWWTRDAPTEENWVARGVVLYGRAPSKPAGGRGVIGRSAAGPT